MTASRAPLVSVVLAGAVTAVSCGGSPSAPSPPAPKVTAVVVSGTTPGLGQSSTFKAVAQLDTGTTVDVTLTAAWSSTSINVATVTSNGVVTAHTFGTVEIIALYSAVSGRLTINVNTAPPPVLTPFTRNYVESLMLGFGPLTPSEGTYGCPRLGRWSAYPAGTTVELVISQNVPSNAVTALNHAATAVNEVSAGQISIAISTTQDPNPLPGTNQVTVATSADPQSLGCGYPQGCTQLSFEPNAFPLRAARAILRTGQTPNAYVHDAIGHGTLGLCHVDGHLIGSPSASQMSYGVNIFSNQIAVELTGFDRTAALAVYGAGLPRGATRSDFLTAGLVNSSSISRLRPSAVLSDFAEIPAMRIR